MGRKYVIYIYIDTHTHVTYKEKNYKREMAILPFTTKNNELVIREKWSFPQVNLSLQNWSVLYWPFNIFKV